MYVYFKILGNRSADKDHGEQQPEYTQTREYVRDNNGRIVPFFPMIDSHEIRVGIGCKGEHQHS